MQWGYGLTCGPWLRSSAELQCLSHSPCPLTLLSSQCEPYWLLVETSAPHVTAGAGTMRHCCGVPTVQNASPATAIGSVSFSSQQSEIQEGLRRASIGPPCSELVSDLAVLMLCGCCRDRCSFLSLPNIFTRSLHMN